MGAGNVLGVATGGLEAATKFGKIDDGAVEEAAAKALEGDVEGAKEALGEDGMENLEDGTFAALSTSAKITTVYEGMRKAEKERKEPKETLDNLKKVLED